MRARSLLPLILLLLIPLVDIVLLIFLAGAVGWEVTVALVVLTGLIGMLLVRAEGRHAISSLQRKVGRGQIPADELIDGGLLIAAGVALLTPGVVTDIGGLLLAIPITRYPVRKALKRFVVRPYLDSRLDGFVTGRAWTAGFPDDDVYTVESGSYRMNDDNQ